MTTARRRTYQHKRDARQIAKAIALHVPEVEIAAAQARRSIVERLEDFNFTAPRYKTGFAAFAAAVTAEDPAACAAVGKLSLQAVRNWRRRYRRFGLAGFLPSFRGRVDVLQDASVFPGRLKPDVPIETYRLIFLLLSGPDCKCLLAWAALRLFDTSLSARTLNHWHRGLAPKRRDEGEWTKPAKISAVCLVSWTAEAVAGAVGDYLATVRGEAFAVAVVRRLAAAYCPIEPAEGAA